MGCTESKEFSEDIHPYVFKVSNLNEKGRSLWSGQLEVTRGGLLLHRKGHDTVIWNFDTLKRYSNTASIFSFESGPHCSSGEGIYAFRSNRASELHHTLQQNIRLRNVVREYQPYRNPAPVDQTLSRHTLPANVHQRSSYDVGQWGNGIRTSRSMPVHTRGELLLHPWPKNISNRYQAGDFRSQEHKPNHQRYRGVSSEQHNDNLNRDLALLRNSLHLKTAIDNIRDMEDEQEFLRNKYLYEEQTLNKDKQLSPTPSSNSEHYAQLTMGPDPNRLYMNVNLGLSASHTPQPLENNNFDQSAQKQEANRYANVSITEQAPRKSSSGELQIRYNDSDLMVCLSPHPEPEVNYAILDIDRNRDESMCRALVTPEPQRRVSRQAGRHPSDSSAEHVTVAAPEISYSTIDFDRTEALTSLTTAKQDEDIIRARHDANQGFDTDRFDYRRH